jgi:hypothetical protein
MKLQQLTGYRPTYPKKVLRGAALTAAALVAVGGVTGCRQPKLPELQTEGMVAVTEPPEEVLVTDGEVAIPEPTEELVLDGDVAIPDPTPAVPLRTTGVLLMPTATPEA